MYRFLTTVLILIFAAALFPASSPAVPEGVVLNWKGGGEGAVTFDGTVHAKKGLQCDACHVNNVFATKKGGDPITMDALAKDKYCGYCHNGKRAFSTKTKADCHRCHKRK
ncbi:MAG: c(7)-type cytochrome triheme domain-containing protein [Nitrospirota bacterium]